MENPEAVTLFHEFTERGLKVRAHVVSVGDGACFVIQVVDAKTGEHLHEEICPPMRHSPEPFVHTDDLLTLEEMTTGILRREFGQPSRRPSSGHQNRARFLARAGGCRRPGGDDD